MKSENVKGCSKNSDKEKIEYKCSKCKDMTFILNDDWGAVECECRQLRISENILKHSGISEEFKQKRFSNFRFHENGQALKGFKSACEYVEKFQEIKEKRNNSILFMGCVGGGKTHLSLAIANELMEKSIGVVYMPYRDSITSIKQSMLDKENYNNALDRFKNAKVLLIDDLWKGRITESDINIMFEIINYRYMKNLPVIVSTEKKPKDFKDVDNGVCSRIIEMAESFLVYFSDDDLNYRTRNSRGMFA